MPLRFARKTPEGVTIIAAAPKSDLQHVLGPLTDEAYRAHVLERNGFTEADVTELPDDWEPPGGDRTFRNAWTLDKGQTVVDMPKAREIWKDKMRLARAPLLAELDKAYLRADEAKDETAKEEVAVQKQELRDVTDDPRIDAAKTPEELKAVWPDALAEAKAAR